MLHSFDMWHGSKNLAKRLSAVSIFTSAKEVMFSPGFVCLSVSNITQSYRRILMKFSGNVRNGTRNKWLDFGGDPDHCLGAGAELPWRRSALSECFSCFSWETDLWQPKLFIKVNFLLGFVCIYSSGSKDARTVGIAGLGTRCHKSFLVGVQQGWDIRRIHGMVNIFLQDTMNEQL